MNTQRERSFTFNTILNVIKQICAIVFPLVTFPYVSRVLGSVAYGKYSYSFTFVSYFVLIGDLGIHVYAVREGARIREDKKRLSAFCNQVFTINLLTSAVTLLIILLLVITNAKIGNYSMLILVESMQIVLAFIGADWVNTIFEDYLYITVRYIALQIIGLASTFIFVKNPDDVILYALILVMTTSGGNLLNIMHIRRYVHLSVIINAHYKEHLVPMIILFANSVATLVYVNVDITMLGHYFDDSVIGIYSFSSKIYSVVKSLINAVIVVAIPRLSSVFSNEDGQYRGYLTEIINSMLTIMFPAMCGLFALSGQIVSFMGGEGYTSGNLVLRILCPAILFAMMGSFFVNCILMVYKEERYILFATSIAAIVNILFNLFMVPHFSMEGAAITTLISEIIACSVEAYFAIKKEMTFLHELKDLKSALIGTGLIAVICWIVTNFVEENVKQLIVAVVLSTAVYYLACTFLKNSLMVRLNNMILRKIKVRKM